MHKNKIIVVILSLVIWTGIQLGAQDSLEVTAVQDTITIDSINVQGLINTPLELDHPSYLSKLIKHHATPFASIVLFLLFLTYRPISNTANGLKNKLATDKSLSAAQRFDFNEKRMEYAAARNVIRIITPTLIFSYLIYIGVAGTLMEGYVTEWLNLLVRWAHVVAGIMWIGASFYFIFLENNLNRTKNIREELAGDLWAVHGGGFYYLEKYKVAPKSIPVDLHWFKYEAYFTFLTGFLLLAVVYYLNAKAYLIDISVADISVPAAIGISLLCFVLSWLVYDFLCKSPIGQRKHLFSVVAIFLLIALAYFLTHTFNSRAAYIHVGAIMGTIMAGNVFFNIIPAQKAMVRSAAIGEPLDASLGKKAGLRSLHNNYFTLPVVFIMISNHFPSTFGHEYNWVVLAVISLASVGIKHYWNLIERGIVRTKILAASIISLFVLAVVISPAFEAKLDMAIPVSFEEANAIIQTRCVSCHSANPSDDIWKFAPNGVMYDTPEQIKNMSAQIMTRAVRSKTMPQGNKTNMTDEERLVLRRWIVQGAKIDDIQ